MASRPGATFVPDMQRTRVWWLAMAAMLVMFAGCLPDGYSTPGRPPRAADVLIDAFGDGVVVYRDGDGPWQIAPRVGDKLGFDIETDRYSVALVDVAHQRVDGYYTTVDEMSDVVFPAILETKPRHLVSGMVAGLGDHAGRVTGNDGAIELKTGVDNDAPRAYQVEVAEGTQAIAFTHDTHINGVETPGELILRRDVVVDGDRVENADFGIDAHVLKIGNATITGAAGCSGRNTFSFDNTDVDLGTAPTFITAPPPGLWRAGDRLTIDLVCAASVGFRILTYVATTFDQIPLEFELPPLLTLASLIVHDGRMEFSWGAYVEPVIDYEAVVGIFFTKECGDDCGPRWSARVSPGWVDASSTIAVVLSPRDLEDLGIWDDRLAIAAGTSWLVVANVTDGVERKGAGQSGLVEEAVP